MFQLGEAITAEEQDMELVVGDVIVRQTASEYYVYEVEKEETVVTKTVTKEKRKKTADSDSVFHLKLYFLALNLLDHIKPNRSQNLLPKWKILPCVCNT